VLENVTPEGWPSELSPPADAPTLTQRRVQRPLLAFQPHWAGPIYLYSQVRTGDPGMSVRGWVRLDVALEPTRDANGDLAPPLDVNSLAHAGEFIAFAQPDEYVIVEPATGEVRRYPLPGLNEDVAWLPGVDHRLLVSGAGRTVLVSTDPPGGILPLSDPSAHDIVLAPYDNRELVTTLTLDSANLWLRQFLIPDRAPRVGVAINPAAGFVPRTMLGRAWASGDRIAQGFYGQTGAFVAVIDATTGAVTHILDTTDHQSIHYQVVGWLDGDSVLISADEGVLAWHLPSGSVTVALPYRPGALSLAP
jgi:hypothetical protein